MAFSEDVFPLPWRRDCRLAFLGLRLALGGSRSLGGLGRLRSLGGLRRLLGPSTVDRRGLILQLGLLRRWHGLPLGSDGLHLLGERRLVVAHVLQLFAHEDVVAGDGSLRLRLGADGSSTFRWSAGSAAARSSRGAPGC